MRRYLFPALMGVVGVAILMSLGFWQLRRMEEKRAYLDEIAARISNAPIPLPEVPDDFRVVHMVFNTKTYKSHAVESFIDYVAAFWSYNRENLGWKQFD